MAKHLSAKEITALKRAYTKVRNAVVAAQQAQRNLDIMFAIYNMSGDHLFDAAWNKDDADFHEALEKDLK